jgi:hypothetical protein
MAAVGAVTRRYASGRDPDAASFTDEERQRAQGEPPARKRWWR